MTECNSACQQNDLFCFAGVKRAVDFAKLIIIYMVTVSQASDCCCLRGWHLEAYSNMALGIEIRSVDAVLLE